MSYLKRRPGRSCFVSNNIYDVFEIPSISNHRKFPGEGEFLTFTINQDYGTWICCEMIVSILREDSCTEKKIIEKVTVQPYGMYNVEKNTSGNYITKVRNGREIEKGFKMFKYPFDKENVRASSYKTTKEKILSKLMKCKHIALEGGEIVQVYKKKK